MAYVIGWAEVLPYIPLYYYRKLVEDRRPAAAGVTGTRNGLAWWQIQTLPRR